jgi:hypothetical protein
MGMDVHIDAESAMYNIGRADHCSLWMYLQAHRRGSKMSLPSKLIALVTLQDSSRSQCMQDLGLSYKDNALYNIVARYALRVDYGHCRTRIATALAGHTGHATIFFKDMSSVLQSKANISVVTPPSSKVHLHVLLGNVSFELHHGGQLYRLFSSNTANTCSACFTSHSQLL